MASNALDLARGLLTDAARAGRRARLDPVPERQPRPGPARQWALGKFAQRLRAALHERPEGAQCTARIELASDPRTVKGASHAMFRMRSRIVGLEMARVDL